MNEKKTDWQTYMAVRNIAEQLAKSASAITVLGPHEVGQHRIDMEMEYIDTYLPILAQNLGYRLVRIEE